MIQHSNQTFVMTGRVEEITPQLATAYYQMSGGNRNERPYRIESYARDMLNGRWAVTHQGLVFDANGVLRDGHHRLKAIIKAGIPVRMFVVRGIHPDSCKYIDAGLPRSARDAFRMAGVGEYSEQLVSTARVFKWLPQLMDQAMTRDEIHDVIEQYSESLVFSCEALKGIPCISRTVRGLVARAWYHVDHKRLEEFVNVIRTGMPVSENANDDRAAITFGRLLMSNHGHTGRTIELERYRKGQTCLDYFMRRESMVKVYGTDKDIFPLPTSNPDTAS